MSVFERVLDAARAQARTVVLPEASDERILRAAAITIEQKIAMPVLLGDADQIHAHAHTLSIDLGKAQIVDPAKHERREHYIEALVQKRKHRGMTAKKAGSALENVVTYACMMVSEKDSDACVAGAATATADVVRNAMRCVGKDASAEIISSCFMMLLNPEHPVPDAMIIGDCALVIDPEPEELVAIAIACGESAHRLLNLQPQIAMLSFSTAGSARHAAVTKVTQATAIVKQKQPHWRIVGEVQLDAAVMPSILRTKAPEQATDEPCNVLIFPNLDAGNIGYKLIERFGGAQAIGPILQGLRRPVNDLSRGCSVEDIVKIIAISAAQVVDA